MEIRMSQTENISARRACSTRRARLSADETLCEPDGETLLADPARALEKKARGKASPAHARGQPLAEWFVSVEFDDCHQSNMVRNFGYLVPGGSGQRKYWHVF
jgi:hypothetical protein